jgi:hypothetical protein
MEKKNKSKSKKTNQPRSHNCREQQKDLCRRREDSSLLDNSKKLTTS